MSSIPCRECGKPVPVSYRQRLCSTCRYKADKDGYRRRSRKYYQSLKEKALDAYGRECACCGEKRPTMLAIDHVDNDGAEHRRAITGNHRAGTYHILLDLSKRGFPEGFQILCHNCNVSKHLNGGVCEHIDSST